jgi:plasmid maintenance system antidote protein VapI
MVAIHPGELIAPLLLEPSGISQSELARRMGFNQPQPVNELVNGKRGFTPKMALLFEQVTEGAFPAVFLVHCTILTWRAREYPRAGAQR